MGPTIASYWPQLHSTSHHFAKLTDGCGADVRAPEVFDAAVVHPPPVNRVGFHAHL